MRIRAQGRSRSMWPQMVGFERKSFLLLIDLLRPLALKEIAFKAAISRECYEVLSDQDYVNHTLPCYNSVFPWGGGGKPLYLRYADYNFQMVEKEKKTRKNDKDATNDNT